MLDRLGEALSNPYAHCACFTDPAGGLLSLGFLALGALVAALLARHAMVVGEVLGVIDKPTGVAGHKRHEVDTPAVGGLILAAATGVVFAFGFALISGFGGEHEADLDASLVSILAIMGMGYLDDRQHISPSLRLACSTLIFGGLLWIAPGLLLREIAIPSIDLRLNLDPAVGFAFTLLCLVGLQYSLNMTDGRNGLLIGLSIVWLAFLVRFAPPNLFALTMVGLLGALLALFAFNWRGRLFLGDCGAYGLSSYFGITALSLHNDALGKMNTTGVWLMFLVPALDTLRLIVVRLQAGSSPFASDNRHLHHLLEGAVGWRRGWCLYMAMVTVPLLAFYAFERKGLHYGFEIILVTAAIYAGVVRWCARRGKSAIPSFA